MSSDGAVRLGALRGKLTMLDVACAVGAGALSHLILTAS